MTDNLGGNPVRKHVVFHGRVQGVCFRMIAAKLAEGFDVTGYVRNLPDGTVELEAQGATSEVHGLLEAINREFQANIRRADAHEIPARDGEHDFRITH